MDRIFLAVDASTLDLTADDRVLADALGRRGVDAQPIRWGASMSPGSVVVVRSTWDYVERPADFRAWLDELDARGVTVVNPVPILQWNLHKRYLLDLEQRGVPTVPTEHVPRGDGRSLDDIREARGWGDVVVKPAIGGTARATVHSGVVGPDATAAHLARLVASEDVLAQPAVDSIRSHGEVSVIAIGGAPLAAILKEAAADEWRVQSDFGGTARPIPLDDELTEIARRALDAVDGTPLYARIDVVRIDAAWGLMELELIEPELFFRLDPMIADRFVEALLPLVR